MQDLPPCYRPNRSTYFAASTGTKVSCAGCEAPLQGGRHGPCHPLFAVRQENGTGPQLHRTHGVEVCVLRQAGPDGDGESEQVGR